jgi:hypothetical protein
VIVAAMFLCAPYSMGVAVPARAAARAYLLGRALPLPAVTTAVIGALAAVGVAAALVTRTSLSLRPR